MGNKIYPIGIQNFESLRLDGYFYIDKTALIYQLVKSGRYYFLSRPRRFGKSLLISTLEAYFQGKKELFQGLAMEKLEKDWTKYPILHIDLNTQKYDSPQSLESKLNRTLVTWEKLYGSEPAEDSLSMRFEGTIQRAYEQTGQRVVILVDEYDKPMLQAIGNKELQNSFRETLKAFYGALKSKDGCIKFAMLTGVTKFGKVSVFSDLNNLDDISMWNEYIELCGISEKEIHKNLETELHEFADVQKMTYDSFCEKLRQYYDGYHFTHNSIGMYNPFSLLNAFKRKEFGSYWFETGTPTYLVELLKRHHYNLERMAHEETNAQVLNSIDSESTSPIPVIYQSGYLTIKGYDEEFGIYHLGFPNKEVEEGFLNFLLPLYCSAGDRSAFMVDEFVKDVEAGHVEQFMNRLTAFFADNSYQVAGEAELYFQNALYLIFKIMGFHTQVEIPTSDGRMDVLIQTSDYIYIIECKLDGSAEEALQQIEVKNYAAPFAMDKRTVVKLGINFSSKTRGVESWKQR